MQGVYERIIFSFFLNDTPRFSYLALLATTSFICVKHVLYVELGPFQDVSDFQGRRKRKQVVQVVYNHRKYLLPIPSGIVQKQVSYVNALLCLCCTHCEAGLFRWIYSHQNFISMDLFQFFSVSFSQTTFLVTIQFQVQISVHGAIHGLFCLNESGNYQKLNRWI